MYGYRPGPVDERDVLFGDALEGAGVNLELRFGHRHYETERRLFQGNYGHCVAFAGGQLRNIQEGRIVYDDDACHELFCDIAAVDPFPGDCDSDPPQDGTNLRTLFTVLKSKGEISSYAFETVQRVMALYILNVGPVVLAVPWLTGMEDTDARGYVNVSGRIEGYHAICVNEVYRHPDYPDWFGFDQSWGSNWGIEGGRGRIWAYGMARLLEDRYSYIGTAVDVVNPDQSTFDALESEYIPPPIEVRDFEANPENPVDPDVIVTGEDATTGTEEPEGGETPTEEVPGETPGEVPSGQTDETDEVPSGQGEEDEGSNPPPDPPADA